MTDADGEEGVESAAGKAAPKDCGDEVRERANKIVPLPQPGKKKQIDGKRKPGGMTGADREEGVEPAAAKAAPKDCGDEVRERADEIVPLPQPGKKKEIDGKRKAGGMTGADGEEGVEPAAAKAAPKDCGDEV